MKTAALLPAAGLGQRLGHGPKALLRLNGQSLAAYALEALRQVVDELVIAAPASHLDSFSTDFPDVRLIEGGASRQATVRALLNATSAQFVLVHDAARPFLSRKVAAEVLSAGQRHGAASAVLDVVDTLIRRADGSSVAREELAAVQTPQAFSRELLLRAHEHALEHGLEATDDASLVRQLGLPVRLVRGSRWLFKVTDSEDLELARQLAPAWQERSCAH